MGATDWAALPDQAIEGPPVWLVRWDQEDPGAHAPDGSLVYGPNPSSDAELSHGSVVWASPYAYFLDNGHRMMQLRSIMADTPATPDVPPQLAGVGPYASPQWDYADAGLHDFEITVTIRTRLYLEAGVASPSNPGMDLCTIPLVDGTIPSGLRDDFSAWTPVGPTLTNLTADVAEADNLSVINDLMAPEQWSEDNRVLSVPDLESVCLGVRPTPSTQAVIGGLNYFCALISNISIAAPYRFPRYRWVWYTQQNTLRSGPEGSRGYFV